MYLSLNCIVTMNGDLQEIFITQRMLGRICGLVHITWDKRKRTYVQNYGISSKIKLALTICLNVIVYVISCLGVNSSFTFLMFLPTFLGFLIYEYRAQERDVAFMERLYEIDQLLLNLGGNFNKLNVLFFAKVLNFMLTGFVSVCIINFCYISFFMENTNYLVIPYFGIVCFYEFCVLVLYMAYIKELYEIMYDIVNKSIQECTTIKWHNLVNKPFFGSITSRFNIQKLRLV